MLSLSDSAAGLAVAGLVFVTVPLLFSFCYLINLILFGKLVLVSLMLLPQSQGCNIMGARPFLSFFFDILGLRFFSIYSLFD